MRKIAIFVEGQTEQITIREFLLRKYCYKVNIKCLQLFKEGNLKQVPYNYESPDAEVFYWILNIGNDQKVLSAILDREPSIFFQGFERIIGVRDLYSQEYRDFAKQIDPEVNERIISNANSRIKRSKNHAKISLCFSIMEIEAWFLALHHILQKINKNLTVEYIKENLKIDLPAIDPETHFFHPSVTLKDIYNLQGIRYDKHKGDIEAICSFISIVDFENLYKSAKCNSFKFFFNQFDN